MLHGGGDNVSWVSHNARRHIDNDVLRHLTARTVLFIVHGRSFVTQRWIPEIAPRPLIIVAARNDDYVPPEELNTSSLSGPRVVTSDQIEAMNWSNYSLLCETVSWVRSAN